MDVSAATLGTLCSDGLLETIEASSLGAAPGGRERGAGLSTPALFPLAAWPASPGRRRSPSTARPSARTSPLRSPTFSISSGSPASGRCPTAARYTLELALLADGVDPANVYTELATPAGVDRAFKALDKIKGDIFWWDNAQEPITWLLEKKVVDGGGL